MPKHELVSYAGPVHHQEHLPDVRLRSVDGLQMSLDPIPLFRVG